MVLLFLHSFQLLVDNTTAFTNLSQTFTLIISRASLDIESIIRVKNYSKYELLSKKPNNYLTIIDRW